MAELSENRKRTIRTLILILSIAMAVFQFWTAAYKPMASMTQRPIHFLFATALLWLYDAIDRKQLWWRILDYALCAISIFTSLYLKFNFRAMATRTTTLTTIDIVVSVTIIVIVLLGTWKSVSVWMMLVGVVFIAYAVFGKYMSGILHFGGVTLRRAMAAMIINTEDGIFGSTLAVSATYVYMFVMLGEFLLEFGAGQFIIDLAYSAFGRFRGGALKVAVFASGLFGMVSGSGTANVMGTGTFTIPLIKSRGYSPEFSGATEAAASTGGLIMPPVMGAAAFIMSDYLQIPYGQLCVFAIIPALFFFLNLFFVADLRSVRIADFGMPKEELPELKGVIKNGWHHIIGILVLILFLCVFRYSASKSCVYSIYAILICDYLKRIVTHDKIVLKEEVQRFKKVALGACKGSITICLACACAGIIVGVFSATGLNLRFSGILITLANDNLLLLLLLAMVGALILGMGMPSVSVYILMAIMIAPALIKMGIPPLAAHMFLFYFGILAPITPPVGICFYAAATIAKSDPMKTGFASWRMALPGFILPFLFVYDPAILLQGTAPEILWVCFYSAVGLFAMTVAFEGNFGMKEVILPIRAALLVASVLCVVPENLTTIIGLVVIIVSFILIFMMKKPVKHIPKHLETKTISDDQIVGETI